MKHFLKYVLLVFLTAPFLLAENNVTKTLHNLSAYNPDSLVRAVEVADTGDTRVCVFCHIPHSGNIVAAPLWNKTLSTENYTMYDSEFLRRIDYPVPTDLGSDGGPGTRSRQCLSCHDGTVAVGSVSVYNAVQDETIVMTGTGVDLEGKLTSDAMGYMGIDLSVHHPVGYQYIKDDTTYRRGFDGNTTYVTAELKAVADVNTTNIKLYTYGSDQYVECSSCHNPHTTNKKFMRVDTVGNNHAQNVVETCTSCHDKSGWTGSAHENVDVLVVYGAADTNLSDHYETRKVAEFGCINCHTPHNAARPAAGQGGKYLLRQAEQETCFEGAASSNDTAACHGDGVNAAVDLESAFAVGPYGHVQAVDPAYSGIHTNLDVLYGVDNTEHDYEQGKGVDFEYSRHVECVDCHNPHKTQQGNHVTQGGGVQTDLYPPNHTNTVSPAILGVSGVDITWPGSNWGSYDNTDMNTLQTATKEYQICFKCHTYWGLGSAVNGIPDINHTLESSGEPMTDQGWEFNPYNRSAHPVVMSTNAMLALGGRHVGALDPTALLAPWNSNVGTYTMYCSDCHGNEAENDPATPDPKGPHGSTKKFMLKGTWDAANGIYNQYWPTRPDGTTFYTLRDDYNGLFCKSCHDLDVPEAHTKSTHNSAMRNLRCVDCHVKIPHGSPVSRLIGYDTFPYPYNDGNMKIRQYKGHDGLTASAANVYSTDGTCNSCHGVMVPGYDTAPAGW